MIVIILIIKYSKGRASTAPDMRRLIFFIYLFILLLLLFFFCVFSCEQLKGILDKKLTNEFIWYISKV